jgi:hypothetical protein
MVAKDTSIENGKLSPQKYAMCPNYPAQTGGLGTNDIKTGKNLYILTLS